jgi:hypothetical protein
VGSGRSDEQPGTKGRFWRRSGPFPVRSEYASASDCKLFGQAGEWVADVTPQAAPVLLRSGLNDLEFTCRPAEAGASARARIVVSSDGASYHIS